MKKIIIVICLLFTVLLLPACTDRSKTIIVGASPAPHIDILKQAKAYIESKGYTLEIKEFDDYIIPNISLNDGSLDANFFQHIDYLTKFNKEHNMNLVSALAVHFEPLGIYKGAKGTTLEALKAGDKILVPDDESNLARAILLLADNGVIEIDNKGVATTLKDITDNKGLQIVALTAGQIAVQLPEVAFAIINGNYAIDHDILDKKVAQEEIGSTSADNYSNIIVVKEENKDSEKTKILVEALSQPNIAEYINNTYGGIVVPVGGSK